MKSYSIKFRYVMVPFIVVVVCTAIVLGLFILLGTYLNITEHNITFTLPTLISSIIVLYFYRPHLKILHEPNSKKSPRDFLFMLCLAATAGTSINAGKLLVDLTQDLIYVKQATDISEEELSKYYNPQSVNIFKPYTGIDTIKQVTGKHGRDLSFSIYFATAILPDNFNTDNLSTISPSDIHHWYVASYHKTISNNKSYSFKEQAYKEFIESSTNHYFGYEPNNVTYYERLYNSAERNSFLNCLPLSYSPEGDDIYVLLKPHYEPFENRYFSNLKWLLIFLLVGPIAGSLILNGAKIEPKEYRRIKNGAKREKDFVNKVFEYVIPRNGHFITSIIISLNIIILFLSFLGDADPLSPSDYSLYNWGANRSIDVQNGEWWRLFTTLFVNAGIFHMLLNIGGLVVASMFIEPIIGRTRYTILFLVSGLAAGLVSTWWHEYSSPIMAGGSGAIFGLIGGLIGLAIAGAYKAEDRMWWIAGAFIYMVANLLWGLMGGVDNAAHIGGLLAGIPMGWILYRTSNHYQVE